jgi:phosphate transport system substrate-binding protein
MYCFAPIAVSSFAEMAASVLAGVALDTDMTGAGSTLVYPILSKWSADYSVKTGDRLNYRFLSKICG